MQTKPIYYALMLCNDSHKYKLTNSGIKRYVQSFRFNHILLTKSYFSLKLNFVYVRMNTRLAGNNFFFTVHFFKLKSKNKR